MIFNETSISGAYLIEAAPFSDDRGWFARTFCKEEYAKIGFQEEWVQENHSFTNLVGTIRGMHFQYPPYTEIKTVRCIAGKVYDVMVDLRESSPSFLKWFGIDLSAENRRTLYIPKGVAHGFQVLLQNSELIYHHSAFYQPAHEGAIRFDDPRVGIKWPLKLTDISKKDKEYHFLAEDFKGIKI